MPTFVVAVQDDAKMAPVIIAHYPNAYTKVWPGLWLVSDATLAPAVVCAKLGVAGGQFGDVFIIGTSNRVPAGYLPPP